MVLRNEWQRFLQWWLLFLLMLVPLLWITYQAVSATLGADPAKYIVDFLGEWGLRFLLLTLCCSTLKRVFRFGYLARYRRMIGMYSLFYITLHMLGVATFILGWRVDLLIRELTDRPYIIIGMVAFVLLLPLGVTSTKGWQKRLGRTWIKLHRLIYPAAILGVLHLIFLIRASYFEAAVYSMLLAMLLLERVLNVLSAAKKRKSREMNRAMS